MSNRRSARRMGVSPVGVALVPGRCGRYGAAMFHPFTLVIRRKDTGGGMPEWVGIGMLLGALLFSGWMVVASLSRGAWVVGIIGGLIFVTSLFVTIAHLFPDDRR